MPRGWQVQSPLMAERHHACLPRSGQSGVLGGKPPARPAKEEASAWRTKRKPSGQRSIISRIRSGSNWLFQGAPEILAKAVIVLGLTRTQRHVFPSALKRSPG